MSMGEQRPRGVLIRYERVGAFSIRSDQAVSRRPRQ
jgi:hypothetical protein